MQPSHQTVFRSIVSPLVAATFLGVAVSGVLMLFHIRNGALHSFHEWAGAAMALAGLLHLVVNWRMFTALFRFRLAMVATLAATVLLGAIFLVGAANSKGRPNRAGPPCVAVAPSVAPR